jgi:hypothetical protein
MKVLLLDVLHDLRAKRLWPVAAALAIAIIAVPVLLLGVLSPKSAPAVPTQAAAPAGPDPVGSDVRVSSEPEAGSSDLAAFKSHNPFRPKGGPVKTKVSLGEQNADQGEPSPPPATDASAEGTTPSGSGSEATPPGKSPAGGGDGSSNESGDGDSANNDGSKSSDKNDSSQDTVKVEEEVRVVSYNAEAAYGVAGKVKPHTLRPNDVFPRGERYFMYSGVSRDGKAIFTVLDPTLVSERKGEGHCVQVSGRCAVLHLKDGEERRFENDKGEAFVIRLRALEPVKELVENLSGKLRDTAEKLLDPLKP